ncbi:hypothetical protein EJB05_50046, partial [Eragrostis curvula]
MRGVAESGVRGPEADDEFKVRRHPVDVEYYVSNAPVIVVVFFWTKYQDTQYRDVACLLKKQEFENLQLCFKKSNMRARGELFYLLCIISVYSDNNKYPDMPDVEII